MSTEKKLTGYPSIDKPWLKYYTEEAINAKLPECTIYEYLWENNNDYQCSVALNYFDRKITYGEVFANIEKATKSYSALGLKSGDIITICAVTIPETIYSFYGLNRLGVVCNMVDPRTSAEGIREYIKEVDSKIVITIDVAYPKIVDAIKGTAVEKIVVISPADSLPQPKKFLFKVFKATKIPNDNLHIKWNDLVEMGENNNPVIATYKKNTPCAIVHTGGTTGFPKGVMLTNENFNEMVISFTYNGIYFDPENILLSIMPPFIAYGLVNGIHVVLCRRMQIVMVPLFDPNELDSLILKYRPTNMLATPTHYDVLMASKKIKPDTDLSFIKMVGIGGDGLHIENEKRLNKFFAEHNCPSAAIKGYGMTEVSAAACASRPENNAMGSVGLPFVKVIISAFNPDTDEELKFGEKGELCIYSPSTMLGYYDNDLETQKILRKHSDGRYWIHSGDIGYLSEDGNVFIDGRIKRMIIRHDGFKIFPIQIDSVVMNHKDIYSCCTVGTDDTSHSQGKLPIVFAVLKDGCNADTVKKELCELCKKELPEYVQPVDFIFIDKMPLTPIGKVDYRALEKEAEKI